MSAPLAAAKPAENEGPGNFVEERIREEFAAGRHQAGIVTRFPPEPNGYLHIGHAKSICLNFGLAETFGGRCHLRFDDTNPTTEDVEYVDSIEADVRWLGFDWGQNRFFASDYFDKLHDFAVALIKAGHAYVDSRPMDEIRKTRGDFHGKGEDSPFRGRSVEENLDLFARMKAGEFPDGAHVLRAKGDMASTDLKMRDPLMYRIRHAHHHRTGDAWCIYPMYDWAHGQSDFIERVTHSICSLEFVNHRPLYHFFLDQVGADKIDRPHQVEFARLNLSYTVLSKRKLQEIVASGQVTGWDDPRMPTLAGLRRRGVTPTALRKFCDRIGVSTRDSLVDVALFEHALREDLNATSRRVMAVLRPLRVVIENLGADETVDLDAPYDPEQPDGPSRKLQLTREIYIEQEDFLENPPKKFFRLAPGAEVRLRYACLLRCVSVVKDESGAITELRCTWDPDSKGGTPKDGRKVKGTLHWVSAKFGVPAEARLIDRLFTVENPLADKDISYLDYLNPRAREVLTNVFLEPSLATAEPGERFQFERLGYFCVDPDSTSGKQVFNRTISLKDSWTGKAENS
jgi:glutaminyl-tRNA synthetase